MQSSFQSTVQIVKWHKCERSCGSLFNNFLRVKDGFSSKKTYLHIQENRSLQYQYRLFSQGTEIPEHQAARPQVRSYGTVQTRLDGRSPGPSTIDWSMRLGQRRGLGFQSWIMNNRVWIAKMFWSLISKCTASFWWRNATPINCRLKYHETSRMRIPMIHNWDISS